MQLITSHLSFYTRSTAKVAFGPNEFHPSTGHERRMQVPHLPPKGRIPYLSKKQIPDFATKGQNTLPVQKAFTASYPKGQHCDVIATVTIFFVCFIFPHQTTHGSRIIEPLISKLSAQVPRSWILWLIGQRAAEWWHFSACLAEGGEEEIPTGGDDIT